MSNYIHYNVWDEITYPFPNFNGGTVEVWEWLSNFIPHFPGHMITYPCRDLSSTGSGCGLDWEVEITPSHAGHVSPWLGSLGSGVLPAWPNVLARYPLIHSENTYIQRRDFAGLLYPALQRSWKGGILVSPCPSVRLSVCGQNRVRSVSSTILIGSISYLHILSSNLRRCVACNARFKIQKFEILANFLNW